MDEKRSLLSEGEQLDGLLNELEREHEVKEIAGWETGFPNFSRALNGILPGLYLLIGPPSCGKTSFAKQLLDHVVMHNTAPGVFFSLAESKNELRIKTLARLSGVESRELRRGSAFLLHWYGVPKGGLTDPEKLPPSWEKVKRSAEEARGWLDLIYLLEGASGSGLPDIEERVREIQKTKSTNNVMVVIDDCQRLASADRPLAERLPLVAEELQAAALRLGVPLLAVWPDLKDGSAPREGAPQAWAERVAGADVILVMEKNVERTKKLTEPNQAIDLHIVKNRGGERGRVAFEFSPAFAKFLESEKF